MQFIVENKEEKQAIWALGGEVIFISPEGGKVVFTIPGHSRVQRNRLNSPMNAQHGEKAVGRTGRISGPIITRVKGVMVSPEDQLQQLQKMIERILMTYSSQIYAVYKETTANDLSYYILLTEETPDLKQAILGKLYSTPIEQLRSTLKPVYYIFFPKHQEALLSVAEKLTL